MVGEGKGVERKIKSLNGKGKNRIIIRHVALVMMEYKGKENIKMALVMVEYKGKENIKSVTKDLYLF